MHGCECVHFPRSLSSRTRLSPCAARGTMHAVRLPVAHRAHARASRRRTRRAGRCKVVLEPERVAKLVRRKLPHLRHQSAPRAGRSPVRVFPPTRGEYSHGHSRADGEATGPHGRTAARPHAARCTAARDRLSCVCRRVCLRSTLRGRPYAREDDVEDPALRLGLHREVDRLGRGRAVRVPARRGWVL